MADSQLKTSTIRLPDLDCPFPVRYHKNGDEVAAASDHWFEDGCRDFTEDKRCRLNDLKAGKLSAYGYSNTDEHRLRVLSDMMNFFFHLDDLSDDLKVVDTVVLSDVVMNALASPGSYRRILPDGRALPEEEPEASKLARDYWGRCVLDAGPGVQARYCRNMEQFFKAVESQAMSRESGSLPDIETYMILRRDNSGCQACFDLLEYALGIDLPDFVINDPILRILTQSANDFISLANDLFSHNVENFRGDMYNIVTIIMKTYDLDLQGAIDRVGEMCRASLDKYKENKAKLPSWGPKIDRDVGEYIQGLEDWISGSIQWSFVSERYFGPKNEQVQGNGLVELLTPVRVQT